MSIRWNDHRFASCFFLVLLCFIRSSSGIDAQTSSILLGSVICYGTESRPGNFVASQIAGTVVPIMQFANSDIEDLKIVDEEASLAQPVQQQPQQQQEQQKQQQQQPVPVVASPPAPPPPPPAPPSIHDDPAIVSAVISSSDSTQRLPPSKTNDVLHAFHQMNLTDHQATPLIKPQGSSLSPISPTADRSISFQIIFSTRTQKDRGHRFQPKRRSLVRRTLLKAIKVDSSMNSCQTIRRHSTRRTLLNLNESSGAIRIVPTSTEIQTNFVTLKLLDRRCSPMIVHVFPMVTSRMRPVHPIDTIVRI